MCTSRERIDVYIDVYRLGVWQGNAAAVLEDTSRNAVAVYLYDRFQKPYPFVPDVVVDIDEVIERKLDAVHCHTSQLYEWLPYNAGVLDQVPQGAAERRAWLATFRGERMRRIADLYRARLVALYGEARGRAVQCAEAFEVCEYGAPVDEGALRRLFPFFE